MFIWNVRIVIALVLLSVCTYSDIRERNIYMLPIAVSVLIAVCVWVLDLMINPRDILLEEMYKWILLPLVVGIVAVLFTKMFSMYIGMGDGYLLASLCMIVGVDMAMKTLCIAMMLCGICGIIYLILDKKSEQIPFAPFMLVAFLGMLI